MSINVRQGTDHHPEVAEKCFYTADGVGFVVVQPIRLAVFLNTRNGQKLGQLSGAKTWAASWAAAAVWGRKCFVKVQVNDIDAHVAWTSDAYEGIHIRSVHIN